MSAISIVMADAIVTALNTPQSPPFIFEFEAQRRAAPFTIEELHELTDLKVLVFPGSVSAERIDRKRFKRTYKPVISILKALEGSDDASRLAQSNLLVELVEQIESCIEVADVGYSFYGFDQEQDREPYNAGIMQSTKAFATAIILVYQHIS